MLFEVAHARKTKERYIPYVIRLAKLVKNLSSALDVYDKATQQGPKAAAAAACCVVYAEQNLEAFRRESFR